MLEVASAVSRLVPLDALAPVAEVVGAVAGPRLMEAKAEQLARNLARVDPALSPAELRSATARGFGSYARYWAETFHLPSLSAEVVARGFSVNGYPNIQRALDSGIGPILVLPHLGGWEWAAAWLNRVMGERVTAVVEVLEPADVYDWFDELRSSYGIDVVPLGPESMARLIDAVRDRRIVCLLSDRDLPGSGVPVELFGETTTLPAGPALLARRTGAPLLPTAVYFEGGRHFARVGGPIHADRDRKLRDDVADVTTRLARSMEVLIRAAPDQWHLLEPNWPSDRVGEG